MTSVSDENITETPDGETLAGRAATALRPSRYFPWQAAIGRLLAFAMLLPGLPIIAILVVLVRLTSPGPGIYRQVRVGLGGRTFRMYKIRTMRNDAETKSGPAWTQTNDPRVTQLGRILRKLHLDEFPQLFNVIKGEMSLIGPRPERPEFTQVLAREIPGYMDRVLVRPGITGLAQINLPPDTDLDSVRRKLVLDLEYIRDATPLLDVRMLACTLLRMLGLRGEYAMQIMRLNRRVALSIHQTQPAAESDEHCTPETIRAATLGTPLSGQSNLPVKTSGHAHPNTKASGSAGRAPEALSSSAAAALAKGERLGIHQA